eukprot:CAMPEP_0118905240 /NCGR_PEP_ID=MMETSP1166-20130328/9350_1 /TAXON_ID=1104430 /ORGANISM="Chrysoreinhardia sp, Strain CCMP3193" /LENGTH=230 /DNA_ID=CAMNT_0006844509 /DNA_START=1 /DNA_END=693 /DNA_ORIENTATION=+
MKAAVLTTSVVAVVAVAVALWQGSPKERVFTKAELASYDGVNRPEIYMGIMGQVFDVSAGRQYYAKGEGYAFFAACDGSKAFVTGDFEGDVHDDVSSLTQTQLHDLATWVNGTYHAKYVYVGLLEGFFYDARGKPTPNATRVDELIAREKIDLVKRKDDERKFSKCNARRSKDENIVWCDDGHVPRRRSVFGGQERCACFATSNADELNKPPQNNLPYDNCPPLNSTCAR